MRWLTILLLCLGSLPLSAESIAFVSDLNGRYGSTSYDDRVSEAVNAIIAMQPDLVVSTGDMIAGQKQGFDRSTLDGMWHEFSLVVADPLKQAGIPFAVTPGNHDGSAFSGFELDRERFSVQWKSRTEELELLPGSDWPRRYALRMGGILLLAFDGTRPGLLQEDERSFLDNMLIQYSAGADATIVYSHLPMWPFAGGREREIIDDPGLLELLHHYGVDVYASGHHHVFYAGVDEAGMLHLAIGALGGNARAFTDQVDHQPHSFAGLDIKGGQLVVRVHSAPDFAPQATVEFGPEQISGTLGTLRRMDGPLPLRH